MTFYKYIFSVVTYRNFEDLIDLLNSISNSVTSSYKVIIVNNFFDEVSENEIKKTYSPILIFENEKCQMEKITYNILSKIFKN